MARQLFTIGYAGFPDIEDFLQVLKQHGVQILIDVRSSPFSAYHTCYNKDALSPVLQKNGILYFHYARQFGARQEDRRYYRDGYLNFALFSASAGKFPPPGLTLQKRGVYCYTTCKCNRVEKR